MGKWISIVEPPMGLLDPPERVMGEVQTVNNRKRLAMATTD